MYRRIFTLALALVAAAPIAAHAQKAGAAPAVSLSRGYFEYDLAGVGTSRMFALRGERPLGSRVIVEAGVVYSEPKFDDIREPYLIPEVQAQLQWPRGRVAPYIGVGGGMVYVRDRENLDFDRQTEITISGAGGVRLALTEQLGLRGELRARGIGHRFAGSSTEWTLGVSWNPTVRQDQAASR
jgi:hypothetical protein